MNINIPKENRWKRGDIHPFSGRVFWEYCKRHRNGERWISLDQFNNYKEDRVNYLSNYYKNNSDQLIVKSRERYKENKTEILAQCKEYRQREHIALRYKLRRAEYYKNNIKELSAKKDAYRLRNKDKLNAKEVAKRKSDVMAFLKHRVRTRTCTAFTRGGYKKTSQTASMLGCSWEVLKSHIENQFRGNMGWHNRKLWHIDHIVPLATAKTEEEMMARCNYMNLRPMWAADNIRKGDKEEYLLLTA